MTQPCFIWTNPNGAGRNRYAIFRTTFTLPATPRGGQFQLFADTRYRLLVNGQLAGHGPARFFLSKPEYDAYDLAPYLRAGRNSIAILINSTGGVTFHSEKSVGGLIAWGEARDERGNVIAIASDASWRAIDSPGHNPDTAYFSFALNPGECLDARLMPLGWESPDFDDSAWPAAVPCAAPGHWGKPQPRSIPMLDERMVLPRRLAGAFAARQRPGEIVHSLMVIARGGNSLHTRAKVAVMTFIHSPREQTVPFTAWWGRYWINGQEIKPTGRENEHFRQSFSATLKQAWNAFLMYETIHGDWWDFYLGLPKDAGLELSAERQIGSPNTFLVGGPWEDALAEEAERMMLPLAGPEALPEKLGPWQAWARGRNANTPCRERAWKVFAPLSQIPALQVDVPVLARQVDDGTLSLLFDFGGEVLGRACVDFTATAGTVVDVAYCERLKPDGTAHIHERYFVDMVERYIARDGRQQYHAFHPRGFRYMEVLIKGDLSRFGLHGVAATRANYPVENIGDFQCSDPTLNEVWKLGRVHQHACMEDAYLDCPWRERGLYSGDFLVQFYTNLACFGDTALFRRCIELFLLAQGENGLVPGGCHGLPAGRHPDYSAIIPQCLCAYWSRTADVSFLRYTFPHLRKLMSGLAAIATNADGLFDGTGQDSYIDLCHMDKAGVSCALNCFMQRAFFDAAAIARILGEREAAEAWGKRAADLAAAIRRGFWDESAGVFLDRLRSDVPDTGPSVPANALPLLYDIASEAQAKRAVQWLANAMLHNFRVADPKENHDCNVTSYFSFYAVGALYRHGEDAVAQQFMAKYWGRMLDLGAWTCWEYFLDQGSRCHAWSSCPTHYLSTEVLGIRFPEPGNVNIVQIRPRPGGLQWASGVYPHPSGPIRVSWRLQGGKLSISHSVPAGVKVTT